MLRSTLFVIMLVSATILGCTKSPEPQRKAEVKVAGLMPIAVPKFEPEYVADQATIKTLPPSKINYDLFETSHDGKSAGKDKVSEKKTASNTKKGKAGAAAPSQPSGKMPGGFWGQVGINAITGGGRPPASGSKAKSAPP